MSISTIVIDSRNYTSYASVAEADIRLRVDPVRYAIWQVLGTEDKGIYLVAATYRLDLLLWGGEKAGGASQANKFPRTGLTYPDGTAVSSSEVPLEVENGTILLAGTIAGDLEAADSGTSGSNIEEVKAGKVNVKFFRPTTGAPIQDESVFDLISPFLSGGGGNLFGCATGTDGTSAFSETDPYGLTQGFP